MTVKVKICGIKTFSDARESILAGADFLGFNFIKSSSRYISPESARDIISKLSKDVKAVGVFRNEKITEIKKIIDELRLDFIQLHGDEPPSYSSLTQYAGVIKTFSLPMEFSFEKTSEEMKKYNVDYFLVDREVQGEGKPLNLHRVRNLSSVYKIFLAGGLDFENIGEAVRIARPYAVDVAGGVETNGNKDAGKIREFIRRAKSII